MSPIRTAIFGVLAAAATLGAAQLAFGRALSAPQEGGLSAAAQETTVSPVNRTAKTDRAAPLRPSSAPTRTVTVRLYDMKDSSALVRIPATRTEEAKRLPSAKARPVKPTIACEPVVSALTEVARLLQPGRCVT